MTLEQLWTMTKSEFDKLNKRVDVLEDKVKVIDEKFDKKFDEINSKLNIMSNINIPKILEHQVETRKELNEKIDKLILQNNLEHKQFAYQIAKLEMNEGFTKIG